jgi:hypothetical protein
MDATDYRFALPQYPHTIDPPHERLVDVVAAFHKNVGRVYGLWSILRHGYEAGIVFGSSRAIAAWRIFGDPQCNFMGTPGTLHSPEQITALQEMTLKLMKLGGGGGFIEEDAIFDRAMRHTKDFETHVASMVVMAWTAFEVLSKDLWVVAMNHGDKRAVERVFAAQNKAGGLKPDAETTKQAEKMVPLSILQDFGYDLRSRMGDLLVQQKKVEFMSVKTTRIAYEAAFGAAIDGVFKGTGCEEIEALEYIRNAIVHAGGRLDVRYKGIQKRFPSLPSVDGLEHRPEMPISGQIARFLISPAFALSKELIGFVHNWLLKAQGV